MRRYIVLYTNQAKASQNDYITINHTKYIAEQIIYNDQDDKEIQ